MCVENTFETGGVGAMHCHPHTQVTLHRSGRYRFTIGDETREVWALATPCPSRTATTRVWKAA